MPELDPSVWQSAVTTAMQDGALPAGAGAVVALGNCLKGSPVDTGIRKQIIQFSCIEGLSSRQIADKLQRSCSLRTVQRILKLWREQQTVSCAPRSGGGSRWTELEQREIAMMVEEDPGLYLDEISLRILARMGRSITPSGLYKILKKMDLPLKVVARVFIKQTLAERDLFWAAKVCLGYKNHQMLFIDEMCNVTGSWFRNKGRGKTGKRVFSRVANMHGTRYNNFAMLSVEGLVAHQVYSSGGNLYTFVDFLRHHVLPKTNRFPLPSSVVCLDNARIHHAEKDVVTAICHAHGVLVFFLPPYSPDLNPIEMLFGVVKSNILRQQHQLRESDDHVGDICRVFEEVGTAEHAAGWFRHCGWSD